MILEYSHSDVHALWGEITQVVLSDQVSAGAGFFDALCWEAISMWFVMGPIVGKIEFCT